MNVMNRKMFKKSRPARDALNQAGGIMDSSPELMQTVQNYPVPGVQNFANGSNVRIPGTSDSPAANARRLRELQEERDLGVYNRNFLNKAAGIFGAPFKAFGAFSDDAIAGILSTLGMENSAANRRKIADAGYERAGEMIQGSGVVTEGPIFDDSTISASDVENTGLSLFPSLEQAGQDYLFGKTLPEDTRDFTKNSLPKGLQTSRDSMFREDRMDAAAAQKEKDIAELGFDITNYDSDQYPNAAMAQDLTREEALYGPNVDPSGMNDYLARLSAKDEEALSTREEELGNTDAKKIADSRERIATEEARNAAAANAGSDQFETLRRAKVDSLGIEGKEEVTNVIQKGTPQERQRSLGELMAEFTDNAPKYDGLDKGLAIAKIGFAIAAGDSPNAMTNIAKGLSEGADAFIKDKANRDAFDRQLKLSALQYGLGEKSKLDTQRRADQRDFNQYVTGSKGLTINGEYFGPGENVTLSTEQMLSLPPKTLTGLSTVEAYTDRLEAYEGVLEAAAGEGIKHTDWVKERDAYKKALTGARDAEVAKAYFKGALIKVSEKDGTAVTSITAAAQEIFGTAKDALGLNSKGYRTLAAFEKDLALGLNKIIPLVIGDTQSANSISDRDVGFVIQAFLDKGIISDGKKSPFRYLGGSGEAIAAGLQEAMGAIERAQQEDLDIMKSTEENYGNVTIQGLNKKGGDVLKTQIDKRKQYFGNFGDKVPQLVYDPEAGALRLKGS
jgi:hypothetical protein